MTENPDEIFLEPRARKLLRLARKTKSAKCGGGDEAGGRNDGVDGVIDK